MKEVTPPIRNIILHTFAAALSLLIASQSALASELKLTEPLIKAWMTSQKALEEWGKEHQPQLEANTSSSNTQDPTDMSPESMVSPLIEAGLYDSANKLIRTQGFASIDEWATVTLRITKAAAAIELSAHPEMLDTSHLETLRNAKDITPEQKQILSKAIERNQKMVRQILDSASKADQDAIKPFLARILSLMEEPY